MIAPSDSSRTTAPRPASASSPEAPASSPAWFCVRTQPKHEHIAAAHLEKPAGIQVFLPRLRFKRSTRDGPAWITEPMFPGYLMARFALNASARRVLHSPGVRAIVHFGNHWPTIPDAVVDDLRAHVGVDHVHVVADTVVPGDEVVISGGAFHNLRAVVARILPAHKRVAVLLEFLGRQTLAEVPQSILVRRNGLLPS